MLPVGCLDLPGYDLRHFKKMPICRQQTRSMFHSGGGNPQIIRENWAPTAPQVRVNMCVARCRLLGDMDNLYTWAVLKLR